MGMSLINKNKDVLCPSFLSFSAFLVYLSDAGFEGFSETSVTNVYKDMENGREVGEIAITIISLDDCNRFCAALSRKLEKFNRLGPDAPEYVDIGICMTTRVYREDLEKWRHFFSNGPIEMHYL